MRTPNHNTLDSFWGNLPHAAPEEQWLRVQRFIKVYSDFTKPELRRHKSKLANFEGQLATLLMARGLPALAQRLVDGGAVPAPVSAEFPLLHMVWHFGEGRGAAERLDLVTLLLRGVVEPGEDWLARAQGTLQIALASPELWGADLNAATPRGTPLAMTLGRRQRPTAENMAMARWLLAHGARAEAPRAVDNPLSTLLRTADPYGNEVAETLAAAREVVSWNPEFPRLLAPGALGALMQRDLWTMYYNTHTKVDTGEGPWGPLATGLLDEGFLELDPVLFQTAAAGDHPFALMLEQGLPQLASAWASAYPAALDWQSPEGDSFLSLASVKATLVQQKILALVPDALLSPRANLPDASGTPPLHKAVAACAPWMVEKLLRLGAQPRLTNAKGQLPIEAMKRTGAKAKKHLETIQGLLLSGQEMTPADRQLLLLQAVRSNNPGLTRLMLEQGADAKATDTKGRALIAVALGANRISGLGDDWAAEDKKQALVVRALVERGADPNGLSMAGEPLVFAAVRERSSPTLAALLGGGADPRTLLDGVPLWEFYRVLFSNSYGSEAAVRHYMAPGHGQTVDWAGDIARVVTGAVGTEVLTCRGDKPAFFPYDTIPSVRRAVDATILNQQVAQAPEKVARPRM